MEFKSRKTQIGIRIVAITFTIFLLLQSIYSDGGAFFGLILFFACGLQVIFLIRFIDKSEHELEKFMESISSGDLDFTYNEKTGNERMQTLYKLFNDALSNLSKKNQSREDDFLYMKNIIQHIGMGVITFNNQGHVQIINTAAKRLLRIKSLKNINELEQQDEKLVDSLKTLKTGGRDLVRLESGDEITQLAIYAIQLTLHGEEYKLVSLQNIQSELEEKEMEAWQNLVKVLTHEIMNSITPITSLARTVEGELSTLSDHPDTSLVLPEEDLEDLLMAVSTIKKRSEGLIRFVQDFRSLTRVPIPRMKEVPIHELFDEITLLTKKEFKQSGIDFQVVIQQEHVNLFIDKELIIQVLINLLKNASHAFEEESINRKVVLKFYLGEKAEPTISISDNGTGIDDEALEKIFIPFFTTKKSGSGIGLSLSRQIMRQHKGTIGVRTEPGEGTEFILKF